MLGEEMLNVLQQDASVEGRHVSPWAGEQRESREIKPVGSSRVLGELSYVCAVLQEFFARSIDPHSTPPRSSSARQGMRTSAKLRPEILNLQFRSRRALKHPRLKQKRTQRSSACDARFGSSSARRYRRPSLWADFLGSGCAGVGKLA